MDRIFLYRSRNSGQTGVIHLGVRIATQSGEISMRTLPRTSSWIPTIQSTHRTSGCFIVWIVSARTSSIWPAMSNCSVVQSILVVIRKYCFNFLYIPPGDFIYQFCIFLSNKKVCSFFCSLYIKNWIMSPSTYSCNFSIIILTKHNSNWNFYMLLCFGWYDSFSSEHISMEIIR